MSINLTKIHYKELFLYGSIIAYLIGIVLIIILSIVTHHTLTIIVASTSGVFMAFMLWYYIHYKNYLFATQALLWNSILFIYMRIVVYDFSLDIAFLFIPPMVASILLDKKSLIMHSIIYIPLSILLLLYGYNTYPNHPFLHSQHFISTSIVLTFFVTIFWAIYHYSIEQSYVRIEKSEREKTFLLKEIHHRVKNNLNMMTSILGLQEHKYKSEEMLSFIKQNTLRINSIALVHELLYQNEDLEHIDLHAYIDNLVHHILSISRKKDIQVILHVEKLQLDINVIIHLGIILNELITNSVKYAFKDISGQITIALEHKNNSYILNYSDNGIGISKDKKDSDGFGLNLIGLSTEQIKGTFHILDYPKNSGFSCTIQFKGITP